MSLETIIFKDITEDEKQKIEDLKEMISIFPKEYKLK
jgi:hypothetical protein